MAVYVDNMRAPFGRMVMCHMIADSHDELVAMAKAIGVDPRWIQKRGTPWEHFDICLSKRKRAVEQGAIEITMLEAGRMCRARSQGSNDDQLGDSHERTRSDGQVRG